MPTPSSPWLSSPKQRTSASTPSVQPKARLLGPAASPGRAALASGGSAADVGTAKLQDREFSSVVTQAPSAPSARLLPSVTPLAQFASWLTSPQQASAPEASSAQLRPAPTAIRTAFATLGTRVGTGWQATSTTWVPVVMSKQVPAGALGPPTSPASFRPQQ
jgi:hypothetical protein